MDEYLGFFAAEEAAREVTDQVLHECATVFYHEYVEEESFGFAAEAACDTMLADLQMAYIPLAPPATLGDWELEMSPSACPSDSWSRASVPLRKPSDKAKEEAATLISAKEAKIAPKLPNTRITKQTVMLTADEKMFSKTTCLKIAEKEDVEETAWREAKEREAKRKKEADDKKKKKQQEAESEMVKSSKAKDDMNNKPYTYDSDGNIIWVSHLDAQKLPSQISQMGVKFSSKAATVMSTEKQNPNTRRKQNAKAREEKLAFLGKDDGFHRLAPQQPSMFESMKLAPGVSLEDKGRIKKSTNTEKKVVMTLAEYQQYVASDDKAQQQNGASPLPMPQDEIDFHMEATFEAQDISLESSPRDDRTQTTLEHAPQPDSVQQYSLAGNMQKTVFKPPGVHDNRQKLLSIGYRLGQRDRLPIAGSARLGSFLQGPGAAAPHFPSPPVGATMGHGLVGNAEEFYFPNKTPAPRKEWESTGDVSPKSITKIRRKRLDPRKPLERVVTNNRQFVEKLKHTVDLF